ncbi:PilZ domain-containing protein [Nitrosomonas oligotropha]|uniref:PilZ domain-containing protein n=1 Tax=Nitrosomonas oligotropha TaxID=42354 RepID=A0A2T5HV22_9PROT|nr:flagellar brake protein [Nitrosomonas oligotropha]PTQ75411.1 PilZ domain-containing protein [Nitrosomonas oligotropha]
MMNLTQIQLSDLKIGQPLPHNLVDENQAVLREQGHIFKTPDELRKLPDRKIFFQYKENQLNNNKLNDYSASFDFNGMQLKVGDKLMLKPQSNAGILSFSKTGACMVTVIGYIPNVMLLVSLPVTDQMVGTSFVEGDQMQVNFFNGKNAFSFRIFVDYVIKHPFKCLCLSFPKQIKGQIIRKSRRIRTGIKARANVTGAQILITNLSASGAQITLQDDLGLKLNEKLELSFELQLEEQSIPMLLNVNIKSSNIKQDLLFCHGVEFANPSVEQVSALRSFVHQEIVKDPTIVI